MKIAIWHNLGSGGAKRALYEQVKGLAARGHTLQSWCPSSADSGYLPLSELVPEHVVPFEWQDVSSTGMLANLMYPLRSVRSQLLAMDRAAARCARDIAQGDFDLLLANSCRYFRAPSVGRHVGSMPKVLYLQEPYRWLYEALPELPWVRGGPTLAGGESFPRRARRIVRDGIRLQGLRLQANEERTNAASFDRLLVNSLFTRESVMRAYGLDAEVSYLGVDTDLFRLTGERREGFVVGLGSETFEKGVDTAVEAVAAIPQARRPPLLWIGNLAHPGYDASVHSLAGRLGVDLRVRIGITDGELVSLLNRASVMIYASRLEPFGLAPLEANACGTPVVALAEGGIRETISDGDNGLLVNARDPLALGAALDALLTDPDRAAKFGERGREIVIARWAWRGAIDRLEASLERVVRGSSRTVG